MAVIAVACTYQCADTTRIARGRGTDSPNARQAAVYRFFSSAFIGFPWPKNAAGMTVTATSPVGPDHRAPHEHRRGHGTVTVRASSGAAPAATSGPPAPPGRPC